MVTCTGSNCNLHLFRLQSTDTPESGLADPDLELRVGPGFILLALLAFLPPVISSFFTQNKERGAGGEGGSPGAPPLDLSLVKP